MPNTVGESGPELANQDDALGPASDDKLVELALLGSSQALELLLGRHQRYLFNIALRFLQSRPDAEDATQEVLLRIATRLSSFRGQAPFRIWAYRIATNHLLDRARSRAERGVRGFDCYASYLAAAEVSPEPGPELSLLVEEAKLTCTLGMLLCFDRRQRLVFIFGELFELSDREGGELLELSPDNFRQLLTRARAQLSAFMQERCGLIEPSNPCRCRTKTRSFVRDGIVDPERLTFRREALEQARSLAEAVAPHVASRPAELLGARTPVAELLRAQPLFEPPNLAAKVRSLLTWPEPPRGLEDSPSPEAP